MMGKFVTLAVSDTPFSHSFPSITLKSGTGIDFRAYGRSERESAKFVDYHHLNEILVNSMEV